MDPERARNLLHEINNLLAIQIPLQDRIQAQQQQIQVLQANFHAREYRAHRNNQPGPTHDERFRFDVNTHTLITSNQRKLQRSHNISQRRAQLRNQMQTAGAPELDDETAWFWFCLTVWSWFCLTVRIRSFWVTDLIVRFWFRFWGDHGLFGHWIVLYLCGLFRRFWDELLHYIELIWQLGAVF